MRFTTLAASHTRLFLAAALVLANPVLGAPAEEQSVRQVAERVSTTVDVTLSSGNAMHGYVVDAQGVPAANVELTLHTSDGQQVATTSDEKGRFGYRGLSGGAYRIHTPQGVISCRAWTAGAAPPSAAATLLVVNDADLARGQWSPQPGVNGFVGRMKRVMTNPFAVATIVGAAVAIPVAIHNANQDDSSS